MTSKLTNFAAIFLLALVAGVFWGTWFTLTRSIDTFSAAEFIHIGKTIIANVAWPMRILMPACILFMLLSAWLCPEKKSPGFYFSMAACLLIIVALMITLLVEVPIDNSNQDVDYRNHTVRLGSNTRTLAMFPHRSNLRVSGELR